MGAHHTKDKGDLGVAKAHADMVEQGWMVLFPSTEHAPFDLVAYKNGRFQRIQVKYRSAVSGALEVRFSSVWSDRHGIHKVPVDKSAIDLVCIYCPETDHCYYIDPSAYRVSVRLRISPSRNNQVVGVLDAATFRSMPD
jgi:hypothetical protein